MQRIRMIGKQHYALKEKKKNNGLTHRETVAEMMMCEQQSF
jgi:hypothetical protein